MTLHRQLHTPSTAPIVMYASGRLSCGVADALIRCHVGNSPWQRRSWSCETLWLTCIDVQHLVRRRSTSASVHGVLRSGACTISQALGPRFASPSGIASYRTSELLLATRACDYRLCACLYNHYDVFCAFIRCYVPILAIPYHEPFLCLHLHAYTEATRPVAKCGQ